MSSTRIFLTQLFFALAVLATMISSTPLLIVRRAQPSYLQSIEQLERQIEEEQAARETGNRLYDDMFVRSRSRKSIPDGYFNEFSVNDIVERQRRGQPIGDTDEFSIDPFEFPLRSLKKQRKQ